MTAIIFKIFFDCGARDETPKATIGDFCCQKGGGRLLYFKKKYRETTVIKEDSSPEPPEIIALNALYLLKKDEPWLHNRVKYYYIRLTEIVRIYIGQKFHVMALEQTSDEIICSLKNTTCNPDAINILERILWIADLVKFAKVVPDRNENVLKIDQAIDFVNKSGFSGLFNEETPEETGPDDIKVIENDE